MKSTLAREQKLKLQAYARLEQLISDVSLGRSGSLRPGDDAEVIETALPNDSCYYPWMMMMMINVYLTHVGH